MRAEREQVSGKCEIYRPQHKPIELEVSVAQHQRIARAYGEQGGLRTAIILQRVVVAVDNNSCIRNEYRVHAGGLLGADADGDEAQPSTARGRTPRAHVFKQRRGNVENVDARSGHR